MHRLTPGMTKMQVHEVLGPPQRMWVLSESERYKMKNEPAKESAAQRVHAAEEWLHDKPVRKYRLRAYYDASEKFLTIQLDFSVGKETL